MWPHHILVSVFYSAFEKFSAYLWTGKGLVVPDPRSVGCPCPAVVLDFALELMASQVDAE